MNPDVNMVVMNVKERNPGQEIPTLRTEYARFLNLFRERRYGDAAAFRAEATAIRLSRYAFEGESELEVAAGFFLSARDALFNADCAAGRLGARWR